MRSSSAAMRSAMSPVPSGDPSSTTRMCAKGTTPWMAATLPYVLYGIFRYIWLVTAKREGAAPDETLLRDVPILATGLLYGITAVAVLLLAPKAG